MTPAIVLAKKKKLAFTLHEYQHDAGSSSYGLEAAEKLGVNPACVFKTLIVSDEKGALAVAVLPVDCNLNLKKMAKAIGAKKVAMAAAKTVERSSGYVLGGVSPLGQKKRLKTVIDQSAKQQSRIYISAGRRGLEMEISPAALAGVLDADFQTIVNV